MVPFLYQLFLLNGESQRSAFTTAVATSLFVMIFTGSYAALIHRRNGMLERDLVVYTEFGAILGAVFGSHLMVASDDQVVRFCFGVFVEVPGRSSRGGAGDGFGGCHCLSLARCRGAVLSMRNGRSPAVSPLPHFDLSGEIFLAEWCLHTIPAVIRWT